MELLHQWISSRSSNAIVGRTFGPSVFSLSSNADTHFIRSVESWSSSWMTGTPCIAMYKKVSSPFNVVSHKSLIIIANIWTYGIQIAFNKVRKKPRRKMSGIVVCKLSWRAYLLRSPGSGKQSKSLFAPPSAQQCHSVDLHNLWNREIENGWFSMIRACLYARLLPSFPRRKLTFQVVSLGEVIVNNRANGDSRKMIALNRYYQNTSMYIIQALCPVATRRHVRCANIPATLRSNSL